MSKFKVKSGQRDDTYGIAAAVLSTIIDKSEAVGIKFEKSLSYELKIAGP